MGYIPLRFLYFVCDALIKKRMAEINSERAQLHVFDKIQFRYNLFRFVGNYSWLLNNKGLNCTHPLRCNVFQQLLRFYMICGWLNPWMQKADCKVPFQLCDGCWSRNLLWSRSTVLVGACMYVSMLHFTCLLHNHMNPLTSGCQPEGVVSGLGGIWEST